MTLSNCKECGRLFNRYAKDICPNCIKQEEDDFYKVSGYLRDNQGSTPQEVHEATEVSLEKIYRFIREGRLIAKNFPGMTYPCERCGIPIQMGRFCRTCTDDLKAELNRVVQHESAAGQEPSNANRGNDFHLKNRYDRK
ncbi:TIGR03826 family flagellar region protein [Effusibacillus consociatus]|uniref:TIGR03826 family flagellar region protein n=1 Tax=Effusibacillus consociatus TaxID=1117041 RepID=A0ABV9Q2W2_9BACL